MRKCHHLAGRVTLPSRESGELIVNKIISKPTLQSREKVNVYLLFYLKVNARITFYLLIKSFNDIFYRYLTVWRSEQGINCNKYINNSYYREQLTKNVWNTLIVYLYKLYSVWKSSVQCSNIVLMISNDIYDWNKYYLLIVLIWIISRTQYSGWYQYIRVFTMHLTWKSKYSTKKACENMTTVAKHAWEEHALILKMLRF